MLSGSTDTVCLSEPTTGLLPSVTGGETVVAGRIGSCLVEAVIRDTSPAFRCLLVSGLIVFVVAVVTACVGTPEKSLMGCWTETSWTYEKIDDVGEPGLDALWSDGVRMRDYPDRQVVRHEAELWHFRPRGELDIRHVDGTVANARWRLKGRGHVLTIRHEGAGFEVYDIKELTRDQLLLNYDMGMEVRGIARLEFARASCTGTATVDGLEHREDDVALAELPSTKSP